MVPEEITEAFFIQFSDADSVRNIDIKIVNKFGKLQFYKTSLSTTIIQILNRINVNRSAMKVPIPKIYKCVFNMSAPYYIIVLGC